MSHQSLFNNDSRWIIKYRFSSQNILFGDYKLSSSIVVGVSFKFQSQEYGLGEVCDLGTPISAVVANK